METATSFIRWSWQWGCIVQYLVRLSGWCQTADMGQSSSMPELHLLRPRLPSFEDSLGGNVRWRTLPSLQGFPVDSFRGAGLYFSASVWIRLGRRVLAVRRPQLSPSLSHPGCPGIRIAVER